MVSFLEKAKYSGSYAASLSRSAGFLIENLSLSVIESLFQKDSRFRDPEFKNRLGLILKEMNQLLREDAREFSKGTFPRDCLVEQNPFQHSLSALKVFVDAFRVAQRRKNHEHADLPSLDEDEKSQYPEYYLRNFHYQTDGYLSELSASLYDHQVEVLFSGAGAPMRRAAIPLIKEFLNTENGQGLHFLEIGAGTGAFSRYLKLALPKARFTLLDLSQHYLKIAQSRLDSMEGLDFIQGDAAQLPFRDQLYDGVLSCFLFHELPLEVRKQVLAESYRALKPGGILSMTDALQAGENEVLSWAIEKFPQDFHEPFFKNYTLHKMEELFHSAGLSKIQTRPAFLSKVVIGQKISV